jgi:precorrin-2 dehydrogenase / sirohydrochlorin ferrochelatase
MRLDAPGFPINFDVDGQPVVVIGSDDDATRKCALLQDAGARVTQLPPGAFDDDATLAGARLVLLTVRDPSLAARVSAAARARGVLAWCSDNPGCSDFAMPAIAQLGPARLAISTAGGSPSLAARLRALLEAQLGDRFAAFARALAARRPERSIDERRADLDGFDLHVEVKYPDWWVGKGVES